VRCFQCHNETTNPKFCSRSCAVSFNNVRNPKRKPQGRCKDCESLISSCKQVCSSCRTARKTEAPQKAKEATRSYRRIYDLGRYRRRRQLALELLGGSCTQCGAQEDLQLDHIDRATKSFNLSEAWSAPEAQFRAELAKCQVLCRSCHKLKTAKEQRTDHGSWGMYNRGKCRCRICKDFVAAYFRKHRAQLRTPG
jgi:hypothetical protein